MLELGKEYNLNNVKEVKVTNDFVGLDETTRKCQNEEDLMDCETRKLIDSLFQKCKCLPFSIIQDEKVQEIIYRTGLIASLGYLFQ